MGRLRTVARLTGSIAALRFIQCGVDIADADKGNQMVVGRTHDNTCSPDGLQLIEPIQWVEFNGFRGDS